MICHHLQQLFFPPGRTQHLSTVPLSCFTAPPLTSPHLLLPASSTPLSSLILYKGLGPHPSFPTLWCSYLRLTFPCAPDPNPSHGLKPTPPPILLFLSCTIDSPTSIESSPPTRNHFPIIRTLVLTPIPSPAFVSFLSPPPSPPNSSGWWSVLAVHSSSPLFCCPLRSAHQFPNPITPQKLLLAKVFTSVTQSSLLPST